MAIIKLSLIKCTINILKNNKPININLKKYLKLFLQNDYLKYDYLKKIKCSHTINL